MWLSWALCAAAADFLPLETLSYAVDVAGPVAEITIRERFRNTGPVAVDAVYVFPLDPGATIDGMWLRVETREVRGEIRARAEARRVYEAARDAGTVAALTEATATDLFTQDVANLPPGAAVEVELRVVRPVDRRDGEWTLPLAITAAPRFLPLGAPPSWTVPSRDTGVRADLAEDVHAATGVRSLAVEPGTDRADLLGARGRVVLDDLPLDRDVVVRWRTARAAPTASLLVTADHALLLLEGAEPGAPSQPWSGLALDWSGCPVTAPTTEPWGLGDGGLSAGIWLRTGPCPGPVVLTAVGVSGPVRAELWPRPLPRPRALASAWAHDRVARTTDPDEIRALGLRWGIVTAETSFVAVDPGTEGAKVARMAPPAAGAWAEGKEDRSSPVVVSKQQILLLGDDGTPRVDFAQAVARRRPWEKTPLLAAGLLAVAGGTAVCVAAEGRDGRGLSPACAGGLALGAVGLGSFSFGVLLAD